MTDMRHVLAALPVAPEQPSGTGEETRPHLITDIEGGPYPCPCSIGRDHKALMESWEEQNEAEPDAPEQPTQANEPWKAHEWPCGLFYTGNWNADGTPTSLPSARCTCGALVPSPSEVSAAPKETVTPARGFITEPDNHHNALACGYCSQGLAEHYRVEVIREALDWLDDYGLRDPDAALRAAREHFGVSS